MEILIGNGYDLHRLVTKRDFILGGIKIDYNKGFLPGDLPDPGIEPGSPAL